MITTLIGALVGVIAGQGSWHWFMWWRAKRAVKHAPIAAAMVFGEVEEVWCPRCEHHHALRMTVGLSVGLGSGDVQGGPVGWFTACMCEDSTDVGRRLFELTQILQTNMDEFAETYTKTHRRQKPEKTAAALIDHMVSTAKAYSDA